MYENKCILYLPCCEYYIVLDLTRRFCPHRDKEIDVKLKILSGIALVACAALAVGFSSAYKPTNAQDSAMTEQDVQVIVKEYLLNNPEVVVEAIQAFQNKEREKLEQAFKDQLKRSQDKLYNDEGSPVAGNPDGDVVMVEFFDYNCGYCKKALKDVQAALENDDNLKVVFKEYPILSDSSRMAARWALAADKQGKYFEFHQALMEHSGAKN